MDKALNNLTWRFFIILIRTRIMVYHWYKKRGLPISVDSVILDYIFCIIKNLRERWKNLHLSTLIFLSINDVEPRYYADGEDAYAMKRDLKSLIEKVLLYKCLKRFHMQEFIWLLHFFKDFQIWYSYNLRILIKGHILLFYRRKKTMIFFFK